MDQITVKYGKLKKMTDKLNQMGMKAEDEVTFEFIVGSLFPDIMNNIKEEMKRQHAQGYAEGLNAEKKGVKYN